MNINEANPEMEATVADTRQSEGPELSDLQSMFDGDDTATEPADETVAEDQPEAEAQDEAEATESLEDGEPQEETKTEEAPKAFKVTTPEGEIEVDQSELINGYLRQSDYTRKTQEVAMQRKEVEQLASQVTSVGYRAALEGLMAVDPLLALENSAELANLRQADPAEWVALNREIEQQKAYYADLAKQSDAVVNETRQALIARESEALRSAIPELNDPAASVAIIQDILEVGKRFGMTPEEMNTITDHRIPLMARENAELRRQVEALKAVRQNVQTKKVAQSAPVLKPGVQQQGAQRGDPRAISQVLRTASTSSNESDLRRALSKAFD